MINERERPSLTISARPLSLTTLSLSHTHTHAHKSPNSHTSLKSRGRGVGGGGRGVALNQQGLRLAGTSWALSLQLYTSLYECALARSYPSLGAVFIYLLVRRVVSQKCVPLLFISRQSCTRHFLERAHLFRRVRTLTSVVLYTAIYIQRLY